MGPAVPELRRDGLRFDVVEAVPARRDGGGCRRRGDRPDDDEGEGEDDGGGYLDAEAGGGALRIAGEPRPGQLERHAIEYSISISISISTESIRKQVQSWDPWEQSDGDLDWEPIIASNAIMNKGKKVRIRVYLFFFFFFLF